MRPRTRNILPSEQRRRVREIWTSAQPQAREVDAAFGRWAAKGSKPVRHRAQPTWLLVTASLLIGGTTLAFASVLRPRTPNPIAQSAAASGDANARTGQKCRDFPSPPTSATTSVEPLAEPDRRLSAPIQASPGATASIRAAAAPKPTASAAKNLGSWAKVAEAMRQGDETRVGNALEDLSRSGDSATRDAARLTRAQLDIAANHPEMAQAVLGSLAETGATPLIRHRAQELLQRVTKEK